MKHKPLDKTGIWLAVLCAAHCLLVPVILPTLSLAGLSFLGAEWLERLVLLGSALIGGVAVVIGMRHHHSPLPLLALVSGIVLFLNKHRIGHELGFGWEVVVVLLGALLLITAHIMNLHLCRISKAKNCDVAAQAAANDAVIQSSVEPAPISEKLAS